MLVKQVDLVKVLGFTPGGISLAVKRGKLQADPKGFIDLSIENNYKWFCEACKKKGCEITQAKNALFKGLRLITDNNKSNEQAHPAHDDSQNVLKIEDKINQEEMKIIAKEIDKTDKDYKYFRAKKYEEDYENARIKNMELRGELIRINPFGKFLVGIVDSARSRLLNNIRTISQTIIDIVKSGVEDKRSDGEMILEIAEFLSKQIENIFKSCDDELKSRISQIKRDVKKYKKVDDNEN